jgi:general nucleoside transport system ATP-binding protein
VPPLLELLGIRKRFGSVEALRGADFTLASGEVHALLGENGAGKSTLMHIAYGMVLPDAGSVRLNGDDRTNWSPRQARNLGLGMVHQHFTSIPALTVAENIALAAGWAGHPRQLCRKAESLSEKLGLPLDADQRAGRLPVALKQRLEIVKALAVDARILLLDEPTAVLAPPEADELLQVVRRFAQAGGSAVLITHKLDEALRIADRVTVLRQGAVTHSGTVIDETASSLTRAMIGSAPDTVEPARSRSRAAPGAGPVLVRMEALELSRESGYGIAVRHGSLRIQGGEIVGIAAVEGNGQRELLRAIAGRILPLRGRLEVTGPIGFIPEDRTSEGLIPELSLTQNVTLGLDREAPWIRPGYVNWRVARARTSELLQQYGIVADGPDARAGSLSGGNQQKLIVARELSRNPAVLVAENPTRGLDIGAAAAIRCRISAAAEAGAAVLVYSSDLDEVLQLSHRTVVVCRGVLSEVPATATRDEIGRMMLQEPAR